VARLRRTVPPHADRFYVDFNTDKDGSLLALMNPET
jgi:hypothetical protein